MKYADAQKLQAAGLITGEQPQKIIEHFQLKEDSGNRFLAIVSIIGAVLVAAAVAPSAFAGIGSSASTNSADEIRQLREQLAEQTQRIDRLYDALGPELPRMEERAAELKKQQAEDAALVMHEVFRSKDEAFNSKLMFVSGTRHLAVAQDNGEVKLLRLPQGETEVTLSGLDGEARCLAVSADGTKIFAGTEKGSIYVWQDSSTNARMVFNWNGWPVTALAVSPDGSRLVGACNGKYGTNGTWIKPDESLVMLDATSGKKLWANKVGRGDYQAVSFAGNGRTLTVVRDSVVALLDARTGSTLRELADVKFRSGPLSTALSRDGKWCAVGYAPYHIGIWDVDAGKRLRLLPAHKNWVVALAFSADGSLLVSSSGDTTASVWETATGREIGRLRFGDGPAYVYSVSISDDNRWLAAGRNGEFVVLEMPRNSNEHQ
jgi:WD40 repeat protein